MNQDDDAHSLSEESLASSTDSVTSSIFEYRKLHGRTYHREIGSSQYWSDIPVCIRRVPRLTRIGLQTMKDKVNCSISSRLNRNLCSERQLISNSHHCLTLGIGGKTHLAPLDTEKITVSDEWKTSQT